MNYTNRFNVPEPLATLLRFPDKVRDPKRLSVTMLIDSPRIAVLRERHQNEATCDVSDNLWMFLGSMCHKVLEGAETEDMLVEEKLVLEYDDGYKIVGMADLYMDEVIDDYKLTGAYSAVFDLKPTWIAQQNMYDLLYRKAGFPVKKMRIVMILRDFNQAKAGIDKSYPQSPVVVKEVPRWTPEAQEGYLDQRVRLLLAARKLETKDLPKCSKEERWEREEAYAVQKAGGKKATKVFKVDSYKDGEACKAAAEEDAEKRKGDYTVEHRAGQAIRCDRNYCGVADFCDQYKFGGL